MIVKYRSANDPELLEDPTYQHNKNKADDSKISHSEVLNEVGLKNLVESKSKDFNFKTLEYI